MFKITTSRKVFITGAGLMLAFSFGRYSAQESDTKETKTIAENLNQQVDEQAHTQMIIVHTKDAKGQDTVTETITNDTHTETKVQETVKEVDTKSVVSAKALWQVNGLIGASVTNFTPIYGLQVSKQFIGPVSIGAFGFTNGLVGVSLGVSF